MRRDNLGKRNIGGDNNNIYILVNLVEDKTFDEDVAY